MKNCKCQYFNGIIKIYILDQKSYKNILIYNISYKTLIGAKSLRIRFDKVNGYIRIYDGNRYLVLFGLEKYNAKFQQDQISYRSKNCFYQLAKKSGIKFFIA